MIFGKNHLRFFRKKKSSDEILQDISEWISQDFAEMLDDSAIWAIWENPFEGFFWEIPPRFYRKNPPRFFRQNPPGLFWRNPPGFYDRIFIFKYFSDIILLDASEITDYNFSERILKHFFLLKRSGHFRDTPQDFFSGHPPSILWVNFSGLSL